MRENANNHRKKIIRNKMQKETGKETSKNGLNHNRECEIPRHGENLSSIIEVPVGVEDKAYKRTSLKFITGS
jgi:hypothetical protein